MEEPKWWYIDALDAIGGNAFASRRTSDLLESPDLSEPGYHLEAPYFTPEPIATRALAFAAARTGHQLGLFDGEQEVAFRNLSELTEFVRRAYVSSGGGDGAGGGGGGPRPPGPPDDGGEPPDIPGFEGGPIVEKMLAFSARLRGKTSSEQPTSAGGPSQTYSREDLEPYAAARTGTHQTIEVVEFAVDVLLLELFKRFNPQPDQIGEWEEAFSRLERYKIHLLDRHHRGFVKQFAQVFRQNAALRSWLHWHDDDQPWRSVYYLYVPGQSVDVLDSLARWPVPNNLANEPDVSVKDYLAMYLASPRNLNDPVAAAIILFAAVCITSQSIATPWRSYRGRPNMVRHVEAGVDWLARQLPSTFFANNLETLIEDARTLRAAEYRELGNG